VPVEILRNGEERTLQVTIAELPDDDTLARAAGGGQDESAKTASALGLEVAPLSAEERAELEVEGEHGVLVQEVMDGPAARAGIRAGDVLLMLHGTQVKSPGQLEELVEGLPRNRPVAVLVQRGGNPLFLALTVEE
jgi:serine protease Do